MGRVVYVAAGDGEEVGHGFSFAIGISGKIFSWGCQQYGQLGNGVEEELRDQEENPIKLGVAWMNRSPDTRKMAETIVVEELEELANGSVN